MKEYKIKNLRVYQTIDKTKKLVKKSLFTAVLSLYLVSVVGCDNRDYVNVNYKFENAVMTNYGNAVLIPIITWRDYGGEAIQIVTNDNMVLLTSSYFTSLIRGKSAYNLAENYSKLLTDKEGTLSYYADPNENDGDVFNYDLIDLEFDFDKAIIIHNNRAVIIPVAKWSGYTGEQIQVITPENVVVLSSNYNTILVSDSISSKKAIDLAQMLVGEKGLVFDFAGDYVNSGFNIDLIDLKRVYNKSITLGDKSNCILPLKSWTDYDGEQFQLNVVNGPTCVCSSFNTILINDTHGKTITAETIAESLNENVINYAEGVDTRNTFYNKQIIDFDYSFESAIVSSGESSTILPIKKWDDFTGEQFIFKLNNGVTILSSSVDSSMVQHTDNSINAVNIAEGLINNDKAKIIDSNHVVKLPNKILIDISYNFPYALIVTDESILILSVHRWADYEGGERLRITLSDKTTTLLTTAYDTKLVNLGDSNLSIYDVASWFNDGEKKIVDLTNGEAGKGWYKWLHWDRTFNYAIAINKNSATIIPIDEWNAHYGYVGRHRNYTEYTEQLHINIFGKNQIYSDNINIKLVYTENKEILEKLADGHIGYEGVINYLTLESSNTRKR